MSNITGRLEKWSVVQLDDKYCMMFGELVDDVRKRWNDGVAIQTSVISLKRHPLDTFKEGAVINTRNSVYLLGEPSDVRAPNKKDIQKQH